MKLRVLVSVAAVVFGFAQPALAGAIGGPTPDFTLALGSDVAGSNVNLTPTLTPNGDGSFSASGQYMVADAYSIIFDFTLNPDPHISGSFTLLSLSSSTQTFSVSATLGVVPIAGPTRIGGGFGDVTYSDADMNGTLGIGADPFYSAQIDGSQVQPLGSFFFSPISGGPGITLMQSGEAFGEPIPSDVGPAVAATIGVAFPGFTLTAGDRVELENFEFVVVPESGIASLFAICLALVLYRFAREIASGR